MNPIYEYKDKHGFVHPTTEKDSENGILFTTEYMILSCLPSIFGKQVYKSHYQQLCNLLETSDDSGLFYKTANPANLNDLASHDNMTAIICGSKFFDLDFHKRMRFTKSYIHPRDVLFFLYIKNNILGKLLFPLFFIITMVQSVPSYKNINNIKCLATDGLILSYLKCRSYDLSFTYKCLTYLLKKFHKTDRPWKLIFNTYFKDQEHPINYLIDKLGD